LTVLDVSEPQVAVNAYVPAVRMLWPHETVVLPLLSMTIAFW
jgi:hypothetical protein